MTKATAMTLLTLEQKAPVPGTNDSLLTIDCFVPHISTVPANRGQTVGLFLREKVLASVHEGLPRRKAPVVMFIHGGYSPAVVAYDFNYKDYSLMNVLARAGCDVFAMTHTGYGASPKPMMDDPCNVDAADQPQLIPHVLKEPCPPRYPYKLVSSRTEFDEIETVANYIMQLRKVDRMSLFGWSTGAPRAGGYAALHPEHVDKLVLVAPAAFFASDTPPAEMPEPGAPVVLQSWDMMMKRRWADDVHCDGQLDDPGVREILWREIIAQDGIGAHWDAEGRGIMRVPNRMNFGWRANTAKIQAPTLTLLGEFDNYERRLDSWKGLRVEHKVFVKVSCASHFLFFERQRHFVHRATREWMLHGTLEGSARGEFYADFDGNLHPLDAVQKAHV
jgi:pimeloyl-ACP methyl ester carboxylesterase